ncbi:MAG TPA: OmpA family protein [Rubrivivax sp.]|nr:OmpA family protein [Rubrivivax sp.]
MNKAWRFLAALALAALLGACATPQGTVVLLPDAQGKDTAVLVNQRGKEILLEKPYAAARLTSSGPREASSSAAHVNAAFGGALAARPLVPAQFTLYFVEGKDEFTDESKRAFDNVFAEIAKRPVPDVLVIGHTDTVGTEAFNDALSRQRAEVVRKALVARGIGTENIAIVGRGKRELVVATADEVAEARNRRVEILVR